MENILILGAAGNIGYDLLLKLIDSDYIITVLDLHSKNNEKKLRPLNGKINIIYGDIEDKHLIKELVKKNDIIINYAGIMPPYANLDSEIANNINYIGNKNIVDTIKENNLNCMYFYMSFISVYGKTEEERILNVKSELNDNGDLYTKSIIKSEQYIEKHLKKYAIMRMPIVLTPNNYFLNQLMLNKTVDFITVNDLNNILINVLKEKKVNKRIFNISGFKANSTEIIDRIYKTTGELKILNRTLYYGQYSDDDKIDKYTDYKKTSLDEYIKEIKNNCKSIKKSIRKTINLFKYIILKKFIKM